MPTNINLSMQCNISYKVKTGCDHLKIVIDRIVRDFIYSGVHNMTNHNHPAPFKNKIEV